MFAALALVRRGKILGEPSPSGGGSVTEEFFLFVVKTREVGREKGPKPRRHSQIDVSFTTDGSKKCLFRCSAVVMFHILWDIFSGAK